MQRLPVKIGATLCILITAGRVLAAGGFAVAVEPVAVAHRATATRLPEGVLPTIGCWFWKEAEFQPGGYRPFLDMVADHASYNLLTTSIRARMWRSPAPRSTIRSRPRPHTPSGAAWAW